MDDTQTRPQLSPEEQIEQLEKQIEECQQKILSLQKKENVDWHSAMFGALNLILKPHKFNLTLEREHLLNLMPTRIDCLVVKKDSGIPIDMDVFRLFRRHNIVELKSYRDDLDESVLWHTVGYAATYRSTEPGVKTDELTITIFRSAFPRKLLEELESLGWTVAQPYHNIFYLSGKVELPIQIVVSKNLGDEYIPLQILTGKAKEDEVRKFAAFRETLTDQTDIAYADAILWACSEANAELFRKIREDEKMSGVLREIMKDELIKERQEGAANAFKTMAQRMIDDNMPGDKIELFTALSRSEIDSLARMRNRTVRWETNAGA